MSFTAAVIRSLFNVLVLFIILVVLGNFASKIGNSNGSEFITDTETGLSGFFILPPSQYIPLLVGVLVLTFIVSLFHHHKKKDTGKK